MRLNAIDGNVLFFLLAVTRLVLPPGTAEKPSAVAPLTPVGEPKALYWDAKAFHVGADSYAWETLGVTPTNGAAFKIKDHDLEVTLDANRPRFEIGRFGVIGNADVKSSLKVWPTSSGRMRSTLVAQGQTPDYLNLIRAFEVRKGEPCEIEIVGRGPSSGDSWYFVHDTDERILYWSGAKFHDPKLIFDFQYLWTDAAKKRMYVVTQNWTRDLPGEYAIRVSARDLQSNTLGNWTKSVKVRKAYGKEEYGFDVSDLPPGFYWINVEYLDAAGRVVHADKGRYVKPLEKMPWEGTRLGLEDTVPPPWTDPEFGADGVFRCWNREIRFGGKGLVTSVLNGGVEQLTRPVAILLDGRELSFDVALQDVGKSKATYLLKAKGADISVRATCSFDGYVKFALSYGKGTRNLDCRVSLCRDGVVSFDDSRNSKKDVFGKKGTFHRTLNVNETPWWWAGGRKGMLFGLFSMKGTHVRNLAASGEVGTDADAFTMRMRFVDEAYAGAETKTVGFYLEPTPVKPKNLDIASWPNGRIVGWTGHLCEYFEIKYPGFDVPADFKPFRDKMKAGKRVFFYNGTQATSPESPFWGWYGRQWVRSTLPDYYAHEAPIFDPAKRKRSNWTYGCLNDTSYFESKLWGVNWYLNGPVPEMKDLYFDLSSPHAAGCPNAAHGCVFKDDFGRVMHEKNLEKMREFLERAYRIVKAKNRDGYMSGHIVNARVPSDVFFDYALSGESLALQVSRGDSYYEVFTPEMMQAMFASKGVDMVVEIMPQFMRWRSCWLPGSLKDYDCREPRRDRAIRHFIAYVKIHDLRIDRAPNCTEGYQFYPVESAIAALGTDRRYFSYMDEGPVPVTLSEPGPRQLWAYFVTDRESVLIVLNDTDSPVTQTVSVKGLSARGKELVDGTAFDFTRGSCTLRLEPREARFVRFARP